MWTDVGELRQFYASRLGRVARLAVRRRIRDAWPAMGGERLLGLGYAVPYLGAFRDEAERTIALMPAAHGVLRWPAAGRSLAALADETELPFPDRMFDRILIVHALEVTEHWRQMMREVWRVLADSGRILVVVPHRRGLWGQLERTPFGRGQAYTPAQLARLLRETFFTPLRTEPALYMPPFSSRMALALAPAFERTAERWLGGTGGLFMIEASKTLYAGAAVAAREQARRSRFGMVPQANRG